MRGARVAGVGVIGLLVVSGLALVPISAGATGNLQVMSSPSLQPGFTTGYHYFVSRCNNNPLNLTVTVPSGTTVQVDAQPTQSGPKTFTTSVPLMVGQEFLIHWSGNATPYHIRCLPNDFPKWTFQTSTTTPETQFFVITVSSKGGTADPAPPYVAIIDNHGVPRWWKFSPGNPGNPFDAGVLHNGDVYWHHGRSNSVADTYAEYNLAASQVGTFPTSPAGDQSSTDVSTDIHELQVESNGNYFLAHNQQRSENLSACGSNTTHDVYDPVIQELNSSHTLVWSWDPLDHISLSEVPTTWDDQCVSPVFDPLHFNGIQQDTDGNIIISFRHLGALYKVRVDPGHSDDGQIIWKLGGTHTSRSLTISGDAANVSTDFSGQHDPRIWIDSTGHRFFTLHDNGSRTNRPPRGLRFSVDYSTKTATLVETVEDVTNAPNSQCCGSARKLDGGGDWLASWGFNNVVEELTPSGASNVFLWKFSDTNFFSYRAFPVLVNTTSFGAGYGNQLNAGMNAQFPRAAQDNGPPTNIPEVPLAPAIPFAGALAAGAIVAVRRRQRPTQPVA